MISGNKVDCPHFDDCSAPLCPLDKTSLEHGIWYNDEEICKRRDFRSLPWVQKQRRIAKLGLTPDDGFFTGTMLNAIQAVTKNLKGADPNDFDSDAKWLEQRAEKRAVVSQRRNSIAKQVEKPRGGIAGEKDNLNYVTSTSHQDRGGGK